MHTYLDNQRRIIMEFRISRYFDERFNKAIIKAYNREDITKEKKKFLKVN